MKVKGVYEQLTAQEQIEFLKTCYLKVMDAEYDGSNNIVKIKLTSSKRTVDVPGKNLKNYSFIYLRDYANEGEKEIFKNYCDEIQRCYEIYMSVKDDPSKIHTLLSVKQLNYTENQLRLNAQKYCYIIKSLSNKTVSKELILDNNFSEYEKENISDTQIEFLKSCHHRIMSLSFNGTDTMNLEIPILQEGQRKIVAISGKQLKLLNKIYLKKYATKEEKEAYTLYCKTLSQCYKVIINGNKIDEKNINNMIKDLSLPKIKFLSFKYCHLYRKDEVKRLKQELGRLSKYDATLKKIMTLEEKSDILSLLSEQSKGDIKYLNNLKWRICSFLILEYPELSTDEKDKQEKEISEKIEIYTSIILKKRAKDRAIAAKKTRLEEEFKILPIAKSTIEDFIRSNTTMKQYIKDKCIDPSIFIKYLRILKKHDANAYEKYAKRKQTVQKQSFNDNNDTAQRLLLFLKNGVSLEDGTTREFDLLDYYLNFQILPKDLNDCVKCQTNPINIADYKILRPFISKLMSPSTQLNIEQIMNATLEVNAQRDENGWPIMGTGRIITSEEKQEVIDFLINNNIPVTTKLYDIALKRYINGISYSIDNSTVQNQEQTLVKKINKN